MTKAVLESPGLSDAAVAVVHDCIIAFAVMADSGQPDQKASSALLKVRSGQGIKL